MSSLNKVMLIGNLGRDPEVRSMQSGSKVVTFSIATSEKWRDKSSGEMRERTEWHNVVVWNEALCDLAERYLTKGSSVYVQGSMQTREFTDKDGNNRRSTEVVLNKFGSEMRLLGAKPDSESSPRAAAPKAAASRTASKGPTGWEPSSNDLENDDIPF